MLGLYRCGRQEEALSVYQDARATLDAELGVEPSPALRELQRAILRQARNIAAPNRTKASNETSPTAVAMDRSGGRGRSSCSAAIGVARARDGGSAAVTVGPNSVAVVDASSDTIVDDIAVGDYPGAVGTGNGSVWVGNIGANTLTKIDAKTLSEFPGEVRGPSTSRSAPCCLDRERLGLRDDTPD